MMLNPENVFINWKFDWHFRVWSSTNSYASGHVTKPSNHESAAAATHLYLNLNCSLKKPLHSASDRLGLLTSDSFFQQPSTIPGRGKKSKGSTSSVTSKKRTRMATKSPQSSPMGSMPTQEPLNNLDVTSHKAETENSACLGQGHRPIDWYFPPSRSNGTWHGWVESS